MVDFFDKIVLILGFFFREIIRIVFLGGELDYWYFLLFTIYVEVS